MTVGAIITYVVIQDKKKAELAAREEKYKVEATPDTERNLNTNTDTKPSAAIDNGATDMGPQQKDLEMVKPKSKVDEPKPEEPQPQVVEAQNDLNRRSTKVVEQEFK